MNGESSVHVYTLPCAKQTAGEESLNHTGSLAWRSVITQMGGAGGKLKRKGMNVQLWLILIVWQKPAQRLVKQVSSN